MAAFKSFVFLALCLAVAYAQEESNDANIRPKKDSAVMMPMMNAAGMMPMMMPAGSMVMPKMMPAGMVMTKMGEDDGSYYPGKYEKSAYVHTVMPAGGAYVPAMPYHGMTYHAPMPYAYSHVY